MKKLFLLPLLTLTLTGCGMSFSNKETNNPSANQSAQISEEWHVVDSEHTLGIYYGKDIMVYLPDDYDFVSYQIIQEPIITVNVKKRAKGNETEKTDIFIGNNISVVVWGN